MRQARLMRLGAGLCALAFLAAPRAVMAEEMVRAYVLVEAKQGQKEAALASVNSVRNCKPLTHSLWHDEIVVHIHCNGSEDLNVALTDRIAKSEAVSSVTTLAVMKLQ